LVYTWVWCLRHIIESTDTVVKRCTQALIDCGATGCFIDIEWAKLNNIPTCPLTTLIPVYNADGTANGAGMITDIADIILRYENHSEHTQLAVTHLGKQSLILGYNWLHMYGNLTNLRRILYLSLAKGNPK
jgi:predicted aspartyl protease